LPGWQILPGEHGVFERSMPSDLIRGWVPVRVKNALKMKIAFSSEVDTGSREENASKIESCCQVAEAAAG
jgi:hypothetical protein